MRSSFAQISFLLAVLLAASVTGCATLPPPTRELSDAQSALARAEQADAAQHADAELSAARSAMAQARVAMAEGREDEARRQALRAWVDADLAHARSREAVAVAERDRRRVEIAELNARLQAGGAP